MAYETVAGVNLLYTLLNVIFGMLLLAWARLALGRQGSPLLWAYVFVTIVFMYGIPVQEYSKNVTPEVLLLSHLLMWSFHALVLLLSRAHTPKLKELCDVSSNVPTRIILVIVCVWFFWRLHLISMHGPAALMFSRGHVFQAEGIVEFSTLEVAISNFTTIFLMGGIVFIIIIHASGRHRISLLSYFIVASILVAVILTNESPVGSRRLVLILVSIWAAVHWQSSRSSLGMYLIKHGKKLCMLLFLSGVLTFYYQQIRNNDISNILTAGSPGEVLSATFKFATTVNAGDVGSEVEYLRSGPFDFFVKVFDASVMEGKSTNGDATLYSLALAIPKALYPGVKPTGDVDELLFNHLKIYPSTPFSQIDYSTSLPAIGMSDIGLIGAVGASIILSISFIFSGWLHRRAQRIPAANLVLLGLFVQLVGSQESGLTAIVSCVRDAIFLLVFLFIFHKAVKLLRVPCRIHTPFSSASQPVVASEEKR